MSTGLRRPLDHWTVSSDQGEGRAPRPVVLPHDAMVHERRDPWVPAGPASGYFPGGRYTYATTLHAPEEWRELHTSVVFEGVYRHSTVLVDGVVVGGRPSGYAEFSVDISQHLSFGRDNLLEVVADNTAMPDTRWYSGSGLYRRVWLRVDGPTRFAPDGVRFRTTATGAAGTPAQVEVEVTVLADDGAPVEVDAFLLRRGDEAVPGLTPSAPDAPDGTGTAQAGVPTVLAFEVTRAALWSADTPTLYDLVVRARRGAEVLAEHRDQVGLRCVSVDPTDGLRVNGEPVLLRGGCMHHDHGVLGAAGFRDAEHRRVKVLKDVGFNAVRAGHAPLSRDLLDACDQLGMYVVDELTDVWFRPKAPHDYAHDFRAWWRDDLASMVAKDRNHPSVIFYSLGNENGETALEDGIAVGREMADLCRQLDPTRLVTAGINPFLNALASAGIGLLNMGGDTESDPVGKKRGPRREQDPTRPADPPKLASSTLVNQLMNVLNDKILTRPRLPRFDSSTRGIFKALDVAGYNYGSGQYALHGQRHPGRVMVGTETNPKDIVRNWKLVEELPFLIGDFMWTAWDYLGEAGIGSWTYGAERVGLIKPYPWLTADCGAVDLIGQTTAAALLAQAAWGRTEPAIVSRPPHRVGVKKTPSNWRGTDALQTWTWPGREGTATEVEVYTSAAAVELWQQGRCLGRRPAGREHGCTAVFPVTYQPGELVAIAYGADGGTLGRTSLRTASGDVSMRLRTDRTVLAADEQALAFVTVELADSQGTVVPLSGVFLRATVEGAASLAGFGSADPKPPTGFTGGFSATFNGRALAVVRAGAETGGATLEVAADGYGEQSLRLTVESVAGS